MRQSWLDWVDAFAPEDADDDTLRRSRLLVVIAFGLVGMALPLAVEHALTLRSFNATLVAFVVGTLALLANPYLLRRTGSVRKVAMLMCVELLVLLSIQSWANGGLRAAALMWSMAVPAIAALLVDRRFAALCLAFFATEVALFYGLGELGVVFPEPLGAAQMRWWHAAGLVSLGAFATGLAWFLETSRRRALAQMQASRDEAEQSAKAKAEFLANMSHEIRTPMNAVIGMTSLLLDTRLDPRQTEFVQTVRASSEALLGIVNDILDFSKIDAGELVLEKQAFDLHACVEEAMTLSAPATLHSDIDLAYSVDEEAPEWVVGDVTRLRQVLVNLISNAVKFTPAGEVTVRVSSDAIDAARHRLRFTVADTGIGIAKTRIPSLFDAFTQADASTTRRYGGTGLGLAITKRLVDALGGTVAVESELGRGSRFIVELTLEEGVAQGPRDSGLMPASSLAGRSVLIVDDNPTNRRFLALQTEAWRMRPRLASNAKAALAVLENERVDLALLDVHMPGTDGLELAEAMRRDERFRDLPVVMLSSVHVPAHRLAELDITTQLSKPLRRAALREAILACLTERFSSSPEDGSPWQVPRDLASLAPLSLLLAEDNVVNQRVACAMLERMGYRADVVSDGVEALEAVRLRRYDLVLMDVQMPRMDGFEAARRIRDELAVPPAIVAMTASARQDDRRACLDAGMDEYLAKPVRPRELQRVLRRFAPAVSDPPVAELLDDDACA